MKNKLFNAVILTLFFVMIPILTLFLSYDAVFLNTQNFTRVEELAIMGFGFSFFYLLILAIFPPFSMEENGVKSACLEVFTQDIGGGACLLFFTSLLFLLIQRGSVFSGLLIVIPIITTVLFLSAFLYMLHSFASWRVSSGKFG